MSDESYRVMHGPAEDETSTSPIFWFLIESSDPEATARRAREVMSVVLRQEEAGHPYDSSMREYLPKWFVGRMFVTRNPEEQERYVEWWRGLSPEQQEQVERDQSCSLDDWFSWMARSERSWEWWDVRRHSDRQLLLAVTCPEWPFAWGALRWLFRAAGAAELTAEWDGDWAEAMGLL